MGCPKLAKCASFSFIFCEAAEADMGQFSMTAKLYLARCLALGGEYEPAEQLISELQSAKRPVMSGQVNRLGKELERRKKQK